MSSSSRGCLKSGCFGCLGLILLVFLIFILLSAVQFASHDNEPSPVSVDLHHPLIPASATGDANGTTEAPSTLPLEAGPDHDDSPRLGDVLPLPEPVVDFTPRPGRLVLDLTFGEFEIRRGAPGEGLRVEADYDEGSFQLREEFTDEADGWSYRVSFNGKGGFLGLLVGGHPEADNRVVITVPEGHPIDVVGEVGIGEFTADLGGLWIRSVDLELGAGDHRLRFDEPTQEAMESFSLDGSIGEIRVEDLGNASPRHVQLKQGIGELRLGLTGAWRNDSQMKAAFSIGEMRLVRPDQARLTLDGSKISIGEVRKGSFDSPELPDDAPNITLSVAGSIGEIDLN